MATKNNCCICGPVKNCGPYLKRVFRNIEKIGSLFEEYVIIIYYDHSRDNTLKILNDYQTKNPRLRLFINKREVSPYRTHRIAHARNKCIDLIKESYSHFPYFIMMDFDDPNSKHCNINPIQKYLERSDWDALSFNTAPAYYDIWGLSIYPFCYSYNHFKNNSYYYKVIQQYVTLKLNNLKENQLLPCISSFNGFAIYRTNLFIHCKYDGRVNLKLVPRNQMIAHMRASGNSPIIFKDYGHVKAQYEDCEHRAFHVQAITKYHARIMIAPDVIFS
jgi:hypothetical protein